MNNNEKALKQLQEEISDLIKDNFINHEDDEPTVDFVIEEINNSIQNFLDDIIFEEITIDSNLFYGNNIINKIFGGKMRIHCNCGKEMNSGSGQFGNINSQWYHCSCGKKVCAIINEKNFSIRRLEGNEDEERENIIKKLLSSFELAEIKVKKYWLLENEYSKDIYSPWILVDTDLGFIKIGWRNRVIMIDWEGTEIRKIISEDNVTKGKDYIHAWSYAKVVEYLARLKLLEDSNE